MMLYHRALLTCCHTHRRCRGVWDSHRGCCVAWLLTLLLWALMALNQTLHVWSLQWRDCTHQPQHRLTVDSSTTLGVGNDMSKVAALYSLHLHWNRSHTMCLQRTNKVLMTFDLPQLDYCDSRYLCNPQQFREQFSCKYDERWSDLRSMSHDMFLDGYFQSWKYISQHERQIRDLFTFKSLISRQADAFIMRSLRMRGLCYHHTLSSCFNDVTVVGVHVRRGNYLEKNQINVGFQPATLSYLNTAMGLFRNGSLPLVKHGASTGYEPQSQGFSNSARRRVVFVVVSDDLVWCQRHLVNEDVVIVPRGGFYGTDLAVLAACQHSVITVGTFGWWGAWLAGGSTVYYKGWPRPGSPLEAATSHEDYYPPDWVGLK